MEDITDENQKSKEKLDLPRSKKISFPIYEGKGRNLDPVQREMEPITDTKFIAERLDNQFAWFDRKSSFHQKQYKKFKSWEFMLSATIPILVSFSTMAVIKGTELGMKTLTLDLVFQIVATLAGVAVVIMNKTLELEEHYKLWKDYRVTAESLYHHRMMYLTRTEPYDEENAYPMLVEHIEELLAKDVQRWKQPTKKQTEKTGKSEKSSEKPQSSEDKED